MEKSPLEQRIRNDIAALGELTGAQASLAELAYTLCGLLERPGAMGGAAVARELRATLEAIFTEVPHDDDADEFLRRLSTPVHGSPGSGVSAAVGNGKKSGPTEPRPEGR